MTSFSNFGRWLPLTVLALMALAFEPLRSDFVFANQGCELVTDWGRVKNSIFNLRHIVAYGLLCLVAAATFRQNRLVKAVTVTFLFSIFLEVEQSVFVTGHCRSWDLIPNLLAVGLAAAIFSTGATCFRWAQRFKSNQ